MPKIQTTKVYNELDNAIKAGYTTVSAQGSARSGKTRNIVIWLIVYLMNHPGTKLSVVRGTTTALRRSVLEDFITVLVAMRLWSDHQYNKSLLTFHFTNGSWIEFFGIDNEQKFRGPSRDVLYVNEANELSEIEWRQLKMRTRRFTIADYNPSFSDEHWLVSVNSDPRTYHFITTYKDNPFLEQTIIDEIESLKGKNNSLWQVYGLGLQAVIEGLIFTNVEVIDEIPAYAKKLHWRGCDWGYSLDPTAIEDVYYFNKCLYVDEICYQTGMLASDIIRVLREHDGAVETFCDSADPRLIQEIYRGGCNVKPAHKYPGSILAGITKMQEFDKIYITRQSTDINKEFKNYTWQQDKEGKWLQKPIEGNDHCFVADTKILTSEGQKRIADVVKGDLVLTSNGFKQVLENHHNGTKKVFRFRLLFNNFMTEVECTPDHKIKTKKGWKEIQNLQAGDILYAPSAVPKRNQASYSMEKPFTCIKESDITQRDVEDCISSSGNIITGLFRKVAKYITRILTAITTTFPIWNASRERSTKQSIMNGTPRGGKDRNKSRSLNESERKQALGTEVKKDANGIVSTESASRVLFSQKNSFANVVEQYSIPKGEMRSFAPTLASQKRDYVQELMTKREYVNGVERNLSSINTPEQPIVREVALLNIAVISSEKGTDKEVYDLTVEEIHEYIANGIVVHNCIDGIRYCVIEKILGGRPKPFDKTHLANIAY